MDERYGYVRRFRYTGEAWHIVQAPPTTDGWVEDAPTLCGYGPHPDTGWGTIVAYAGHLKVCSRCERVRLRDEERAAARQELRWGREEATS